MADKKFPFVIQSPDGKSVSDTCESLNLTLSDGDIGILKDRYPVIGIIEICQMTYKKGGKTYAFAINGGILDVRKKMTYILADTFESKEEIDIDRANEAKARAQGWIKKAHEGVDGADLKRAELALKKAINRISVSNRK